MASCAFILDTLVYFTNIIIVDQTNIFDVGSVTLRTVFKTTWRALCQPIVFTLAALI